MLGSSENQKELGGFNVHPILVSYVVVVLLAMFVAVVQAVFELSKSDWGSWVQAIGSVAAVFAAIGLFVTQQRRDRTKAEAKVTSCRVVLRQLALKALELVVEAENPVFVYRQVGTWSQYAHMRARQLSEFHSFVCSLPIEQLTEGDLLRSAAELRLQLRQFEAVIRESNFESGGPGWARSEHMITLCKNELKRICMELGVTEEVAPGMPLMAVNDAGADSPLATSN